MSILLPSAAVLGLFLSFLFVERVRLIRLRRAVPSCVAITGTRGKSTVTRLIAAALRASGRRVVAKTTGSRPMVILPGGEEFEVDRPGPPSILEQKRLLDLAVRHRADVLVAEMMSVGPECLGAESGRILRPDILALTNVRLDHREELGRTKEAAAASFTAAIRPGGTVLIPEEEVHPVIAAAARNVGARLVKVLRAGRESLPEDLDFPENTGLALAVCDLLGLDREASLRGMRSAAPDFGRLRIWKLAGPEGSPSRFAVSVFAANEPESTGAALLRSASAHPELPGTRIGILCFRADRDDRTRQWLEAAAEGFFEGYAGLVTAGDHAGPICRRLKGRVAKDFPLRAVSGRAPARILAAARALAPGPAVFVGMGNIVGTGAALVEFWNREGEPVP